MKQTPQNLNYGGKETIRHAFEAGRRGKPDELDGIIANKLSAYFLAVDPQSRFDIRVAGTWRDGKPHVSVSGEVSRRILERPETEDGISSAVLGTYNAVHKERRTRGEFGVSIDFKPQADVLATNTEAGDSGNPIAVAYRDAPNYLPWERYLAVRIRNIIDGIFQGNGKLPAHLGHGEPRLRGLRADGKVSVEAEYEGADLKGIRAIVIAAEHGKSLHVDELRDRLEWLVSSDLAYVGARHGRELGSPKIIVNGRGAWNEGGWKVDSGTREAKPYRDGFGSYGVCEDSFSGEDPSKPSATGTILARQIAVSVVANGLADFARVGLSYWIGIPEVELNISTQNTARAGQEEIAEAVRAGADLGINAAIERFGLRDALTVSRIADAADYFHPASFAWNRPARLDVGSAIETHA